MKRGRVGEYAIDVKNDGANCGALAVLMRTNQSRLSNACVHPLVIDGIGLNHRVRPVGAGPSRPILLDAAFGHG